MQLTIIRHTSVNVPKNTCYGITDVPLAKTFPEEMEKIRHRLKDEIFDAAFSSPLSRCTILASAIINDQAIQADPRLVEMNFGIMEMTDWDTIFETPEGKNWFNDYITAHCPEGESFNDLIQRARSFLEDLQQTPFDKVIVFTHAGIIRALMVLLQHKTPGEAFSTSIEYGEIINFTMKKINTHEHKLYNS